MAHGQMAQENTMQMTCPRIMLIHFGNTPAQSQPNGIELANKFVPTVPKHWTMPNRASPIRQFVVKLLLRIRLQMSHAFHAVTCRRVSPCLQEGEARVKGRDSHRRSACRRHWTRYQGRTRRTCQTSLMPLAAKERLLAECRSENWQQASSRIGVLTRTEYRAISG